jgi:hypothetical protein
MWWCPANSFTSDWCTEVHSLKLPPYVSGKGRFWGFLVNHLVATYGGGGVPGTLQCSLLTVRLLDELLAELIPELISTHVVRVPELVADGDDVEGCDWP